MLFVLSKIVGFFVLPSNAIALICLLGLVLWLVGRRRAGGIALTTGIVMLLVCGFSPLGHVLLLGLSERFPPWRFDGRTPDGIIVLGGGIDSDVSAARGDIELYSSAERILAMLELAKRFPKARILFSGGSADLLRASTPEAPLAEQVLHRCDLDNGRVVLDGASRTTLENAERTRKLVGADTSGHWLLVTSAFHMPRSIGVFRAAGFDVEAYPVDWRTRGWIDAAAPFGKVSAGLAQCDAAVHEWVGLLVYWLAGRSSALLPSPRPK